MSGAQVLEPPPPPDSPVALRKMMISEFCEWLRARTNREGRPFQEDTVSAYRDAAVALDAWMKKAELEADFTGCGTAVLNRFFADYQAAHSQTGTNTKQRNLRHLFTWLEKAYGHPHPYTGDLNRYSPVRTRPSTLAQQFIDDLLEVTGGGQARDFAPARDHAMIRMLTEGVTAGQARDNSGCRSVLAMVTASDKPECFGLLTTPSTALVPLVPVFSPAERLALAGYLAGYSGLTRQAYELDLRQFAG
jgi:hypothetical protein